MKRNLNKTIYIVDCDYLYKTSDIPNYRAMKLVSYHKQLGHRTIFVSEEYHLDGEHDVLYLIRELRHTPIPPGDVLDDRRTILMGKEFQIFEDVQELPIEAAVCRPDYSLYDYDTPNIYSKASYVQFFNGSVMLKNVQDWHREFSKATVIVDEKIWDAPAEAIVAMLSTLYEEPQVIFMHPIKIKKLLDRQVLDSFKQLKLAKLYKIRYNNNIGEDYNSMCKAIDVISELKINFPYLNIGSMPVRLVVSDHWKDRQNIYNDFERALKIMVYAQAKRVRINFKYPTLRLASPSWHYFDFFKTWSNHHHTLCYVEARLLRSLQFYNMTLDQLLQDERKWNTLKIKETIYLIAAFPELIKQYGFIGWGGVRNLSADKVDINYIKEKAVENHIL